MTEDDKELVEAMKDAVLHGAGFLKNGKHVPIDDVYLDPRDGRIEALSAENERLREALTKLVNSTGCCDACECWRKLRAQASAALGETK